MADRYKPGDRVPASGVYQVIHDPRHTPEHQVACIEGKRFPRCLTCSYPRFHKVATAARVEADKCFKLPKPPTPKPPSSRTGLLSITLCLLLVAILGTCIIRSAPGLAEVRWIAASASVLFFPVNRSNENHFLREEAERDLLEHFLDEVGIALVVAVILGACFEIFMRRREERQHHKHIQDIEKTVFSSLLGYFVPASISDEVRRVFEQKIMRSNLKLTFKFANAPAPLLKLDSSLILVTVTIEYDLVNLTTKATHYTVDHGFEPILALDSIYNRFVRLKITRGDEPTPLLYWTDTLPVRKVLVQAPKPCVRSLVVEDCVEIGPGVESGSRDKNAVHVRLEYQVVRRSRDQDTWTTWLPADRLEVKAEMAGGSRLDLDFHLEESHPVDFEESQLSKTDRKWFTPCYEVEKDAEKEAVSIGVLPFQGFTLYWFPRGEGCTMVAEPRVPTGHTEDRAH